MADDALKTDLYQLTMLSGYEHSGKEGELAAFDLFFRKLPEGRNYIAAAGLEQALEYLQNLHFTENQIAYIRSLPAFKHAPESFFQKLKNFKFSGDVWAVPEGTPVFPNEPLIMVRAPLFESQLVETYLLTVIGSASMFASKASRVVNAAAPQGVLEFGSRRSHDPEAAVICARAAYLVGAVGTSNVEAGFRYGVPVMGTMAHAFVMSFDSELAAFRAFAAAFPENSVLLVDTYDIKQGVKNAIIVAKEMEGRGQKLKGIRIDSGDLAFWSKEARAMLDAAGLHYVKITLSNDLDEFKILELRKQGAAFDFLGVGTMLATSADAPHLGVVYKLCEQQAGTQMEPRIKISEGKTTLPGLKQVYRFADEHGQYTHDEICLAGEEKAGIPLLENVMEGGELLSGIPSLGEMRKHHSKELSKFPKPLLQLQKSDYPVSTSIALEQLKNQLIYEAKDKKRMVLPGSKQSGAFTLKNPLNGGTKITG